MCIVLMASGEAGTPDRIEFVVFMNRIEKFFGVRNEAKVRYLDGEFEVLAPGEFVRCAVTGQQIALTDLRYWSVDAQEAYASAAVSVKRYLELTGKARG
jgi:hypothetical protein